MKQALIFIVDDDPIFAEMLRDRLSENPALQIEMFGTGEACLPQLYREPQYVILDHHLNSVFRTAADGMEILDKIKHLSKAHVIMLSAKVGYGTALQSLVMGAEQYVLKDESSFDKISTIINEGIKKG